MIRLALSLCLALLLLVCSSALAQWSTVKGRFTVVGDVTPPVKLVCNKDEKTCCVKPLYDESLVVSDKKELANVFVYARGKIANINPVLKANLQPLVIDNIGCVFKPHAAILWTEQKLEFRNLDDVGHNTNYGSAIQGFNPSIAAAGKDVRELKQSENVPQNISCNIHPWMHAKLLVRDNPYFAVSAADGSFEIKDVPNNEEIEFVLWHERAGYLKDLPINGGKTDSKGRFKLKAAQNTDLGEIKIDAKELK